MHSWSATFVLIVVLAGCLPVNVLASARVDFGPYTLDSNSAKFVSTKQTTNIIIQTSDSASKPTVVISVYGQDLPDDLSDKFLSINNGDEFNIDTVDPNARAGASASSLITQSFSVLFSVGLVHALSKNKWLSLLSFVFGLLALTSAQDELRIEITLTVPSNTPMDSFSAYIAQGSVYGGSAKFNYLQLDLCSQQLAGTSQVSLSALGVRRGLSVCSKGDIAVSNVTVLTLAADIALTSQNGGVSTNFVESFAGVYSVNYTGGLKVSGNCVRNTNASTSSLDVGTCRHGLYSTFTASGSNVKVDFADGCPSADPEAVDFVPRSPSLSTMRPEVTSYPLYWTVLSYYSKYPASTSLDENNHAIARTVIPAYWYQSWELFHTSDLLFVRNQSDFEYHFSFEMSTNDTSLNFTQVNIVLFNKVPTFLPTDGSIFNTTYILDSQPVVTQFTGWNNTSWTKFEGVVKSPVIDQKMTIGAFFNQTARLPKAVQLTFRNLRISVPETSIEVPQLVSGDNDLVASRKPSKDFDDNPRTDCPHEQSDLLLWQSPATWGGQVPSPSSTITLPSNTKVLVTSCSFEDEIYEKIIVPAGSELVFGDAPISLKIKNMKVNGRLRIGSPTCRLYSDINITFYGNKTTLDTIDTSMGSKGIGVDGQIDLHGKQYHYTWTRLAATVWPGDNQIWLQDDVNWHVGQQVVVVTTDVKDETTKLNEVMTIKAIAGRQVEFYETFKNIHYGGQEYQAEVGLLSRRITVQGDASSDNESFGGHMMVRGEGRFSGVRAYRMGQTNQLARYPFHFHLMEQSPESYVRDCSIHSSYYRCVSIHDTHAMNVIRNVAYDVKGHCYYLEEGVEENNTIAYNLASFVHTIGGFGITGQPYVNVYNESDTLRLPADVAASGFYITNPYNHIYGNAASGGWAGFAFPNLATPIGLSKDRTDFSPEKRNVLEFDGNVAHSGGSGSEGAPCLYMGGRLWIEPSTGMLAYDAGRQERNPVNFNVLTNFKTYSCYNGVMFWGNKLELRYYEAYDFTLAARLFMGYLNTAVISPITANTRFISTTRTTGGFTFYDTVVKGMVANVEYRYDLIRVLILTDKCHRNYVPVVPRPDDPSSDNVIFAGLTHSDVFKPQGISATNNISFTNVPRSQWVRNYNRDTGSSRYFNIVDIDGSVTGKSTPQVIGSYSGWWTYDNSCVNMPDWQAQYCEKGDKEVVSLAVTVPGLIEFNGGSMYGSEDYANIKAGVSSLFSLPAGVSRVNKTCPITRNPQITGISKVGWHMAFNGTRTPRSMRAGTFQIPYGQYILFSANYPTGTTFNITVSRRYYGNMAYLSQANSLQDVLNGNGTLYYFSAPHLFIKMVDRTLTGSTGEYWDFNGLRLYNVYTDNFYNIEATCSDGGTGWCTLTDASVPNF